jgi:diguanylate cyclase (GGDEF)-like protein
MALMDALTGIANRRAFFDRVEGRTEVARDTSCRQGVLYIDIDHFKHINDRWGHAAGDAVLKDFASLLKASMRESDLIARMGGEEFVVHLLDVSPSSLAAIAAGIGAKVRGHTVVFEGTALRYTVSIGAAIGHGRHSSDQLITAADRALYSVKNSGRDGYSVAVLDVAAVERQSEIAGGAAPLSAPVSRARVA